MFKQHLVPLFSNLMETMTEQYKPSETKSEIVRPENQANENLHELSGPETKVLLIKTNFD